MSATAQDADVQTAQETFLDIMPDIEKIAACAFRQLDPDAREEAVAEAVAQCWQNHLHCHAEGKAPGASSMAYYAVQSVRSGHLFAGSSSTDVLSPRTQVMGRARVRSLDAASGETFPGDGGRAWWNATDALVDRRVWERPFERVRVKLDYGKFLKLPEVTAQERETFSLLAWGYGTGEIAERLEVSSPRVCEIKGRLGDKLRGFLGRGIMPVQRREIG